MLHWCPLVSLADGRKSLEWLEGVLNPSATEVGYGQMNDAEQVDRSCLNLELASTLKLRQQSAAYSLRHMRVVPHLEMIKAENFDSKLPWNRHKRRRLRRAKVLHLFSGQIKPTGIDVRLIDH